MLGSIAYQAPELFGPVEDDDMDTESSEADLADEPLAEEIYSDKLTTKSDVYAYGAVTLEVRCGILVWLGGKLAFGNWNVAIDQNWYHPVPFPVPDFILVFSVNGGDLTYLPTFIDPHRETSLLLYQQ